MKSRHTAESIQTQTLLFHGGVCVLFEEPHKTAISAARQRIRCISITDELAAGNIASVSPARTNSGMVPTRRRRAAFPPRERIPAGQKAGKSMDFAMRRPAAPQMKIQNSSVHHGEGSAPKMITVPCSYRKGSKGSEHHPVFARTKAVPTPKVIPRAKAKIPTWILFVKIATEATE